MHCKLSERGRRILFSALMTALVCGIVIEGELEYPGKITLFEGEQLPIRSASAYSIDAPAGIGGVLNDDGTLTSDSYGQYIHLSESGNYEMTVKLFGVIPVRSVTVDVKPQPQLAACGNTVGIKIFTKGLVCVGTQEIKSDTGYGRDLSREADIRCGDIFMQANGAELNDTEELSKIVEESQGNPIEFVLLRDGQELCKTVAPLQTADGFKLGIWLRDSTAGIGTLTFYVPETKSFGALGHPITDGDTGTLMPVADGTLLRAGVFSVKKGEKGEPGELKGVFKSSEPILGTIAANTEQGIVGKLQDTSCASRLYPAASRSQVREGAATILSNISGETVEEFSIEIQKANRLFGNEQKDMVIHITDPILLEKTGGIVQGMSGSPIVQDEAIVGAVTHVFVNDPTRGYGIYIENMLANLPE